jgi:hypothetical protein
MCNAHNHHLNCRCGWGGDGHAGSHASTSSGGSRRVTSFSAGEPRRTKTGGWLIDYPWDNFCRPTSCPVCRAKVFFVRHNGGSAWFDGLGYPWPKHGCFDRQHEPAHDQADQTFASKLSSVASAHNDLLAVIIAGESVATPRGRRYTLRCADGIVRHVFLPPQWLPSQFVGQFAIIARDLSDLTIVSSGQRVQCGVTTPTT